MKELLIPGDVVATPAIGGTSIVLLAVSATGAFVVLSVMAYIRKKRKGQNPLK